MFKILAFLILVYVAYKTGFNPEFNKEFVITALVLLGVGAIADVIWSRIWHRLRG